MYTLTDRRFQQAEDIFEKYQGILIKNLEYDTHDFELELRNCWSVGYQEIKSILIDLIEKYPKFRYLTLYYMQFQNPSGPVWEFLETLAEQYGMEYYHSSECKRKQEEFWEHFKKTTKEELGKE
jgi:hypothetical protein